MRQRCAHKASTLLSLATALDSPGSVRRVPRSSQTGAAAYLVVLDEPTTTSADDGVRVVARFADRQTLASLTVAQTMIDDGERSEAGWKLTLGGAEVTARSVTAHVVQFHDLAGPVRAASASSACELGRS